jgi:GNAT superfamily N-acetyltransferase
VIARRADGYEISDDNDRLNIDLIHHWLSTDAFWALGRSLDTVRRSVEGSVNFGVYDESGRQVAFARVVTDLATFAWLCDVYVEPAHRGLGIGTWLAATVRDHLAPTGSSASCSPQRTRTRSTPGPGSSPCRTRIA